MGLITLQISILILVIAIFIRIVWEIAQSKGNKYNKMMGDMLRAESQDRVGNELAEMQSKFELKRQEMEATARKREIDGMLEIYELTSKAWRKNDLQL